MLTGEEVFKNPLDGMEDEPVDGRNGTSQPQSTSKEPRGDLSPNTAVDVPTDGSNSPETIANDNRFHRTEEINVDLDADDAISVDISDALSERDKVKYTVHTKTRLPDMHPETSVVREHEEFLWLHSVLDENEKYAGFIVPPAPPRPDFDSSREKLQKLGEGEATMTKEEFSKMKQELEQDYLAQFKKTVAMHEVFLQRIAAHPMFRQDSNFRVFLQYENERSAQLKKARNSYLFDDGRCFVRRLVRNGVSDIYLDVVTCGRCDSRMKITQRQGKFKGELRSYWAYRCYGCQSFRSLVRTDNSPRPPLRHSKLRCLTNSIMAPLNMKRELKSEQNQLPAKRPTQAPPVQDAAEGGCLVFIPRVLSPTQVLALREAFFQIVTDRYHEQENSNSH